jgi:hypothetical protein
MEPKKDLPPLRESFRAYLRDTIRARLRHSVLERYPGASSPGLAAVKVLLFLAALVGVVYLGVMYGPEP